MQVPLCRHLKSNGIQCHAVALSDSVFCYFHRRLNEGHRIYRSTMIAKRNLLDRGHIIALPALEDRVSVQLALSEVINALACNFIDSKRANALFFGLQLAAANAKGLEAIPQPNDVVRHFSHSPDILDSVAVDIAPPGRTVEIEVPLELKDPGIPPLALAAGTVPPPEPATLPTLALCASAGSLCHHQPAAGNICSICPHTAATLQSTEPQPQPTLGIHQPATQHERT